MSNRFTVLLALACCALSAAGSAQERGSAWTAVGGGALGLYSGAMLGALGSMVPCTETYAGPTCVRWSALTAGAIGLAGGVAAGASDERTIGSAATGAGVGFLIGAGTGILLKPLVQRFSWQDVAALGLVGGAIGSAPTGSAIGIAAGGVTGLLLWQAVDGFEMPHAIALALAGLAVGGLAEWVADGTGTGSTTGPAVQLTIPVRLNLR